MIQDMNRERFFFEKLTHLQADSLIKVQQAYSLGKEYHRLQKRDGGQRFFEHPRDVAIGCIDLGYKDRDTVIEALLHDSIEDTFMPPTIIIDLFGMEVWRGILTLSKYLPVVDPVSGMMNGRLRKADAVYYEALEHAPVRERVIKCVDRKRNMSDMASWEKPRRQKYALETRERIIPIAEKTDKRLAHELNELCDAELGAE